MAGNGLIGALRVTLGANTAEFDRSMDRAKRNVRDTTKGFEGMSRQAKSAGHALKGAFAGIAAIGVGGAASAYLSLADEAKNIAAQLQLATARSGSFAQAQEDVARIASTTREGLAATAALYGNFMRAVEPLGKGQAEAARATETFGKALKIGKAGANAAASATLQFGQALASGALRGDEFNSIAEASPRIVRLIGEAMGVTQGQVRALAAEGKLTSDVLFRALTDRKFTAGIDAEFNKLPLSFDQSMTLVRNAAVTTFGAFDQGGQFSTMLADFVGRGADGFANLAKSAEAEGRSIRGTFEGLRDVFAPLADGARAAFGDVRREANYARETIASVLSGFDQLYNLYAKADNFGTRIENRLKNASGIGTPKPLIATRDSAGQFLRTARRSDAQSRVDAAARRLEGMGFEVPRNADGSVNEAGIKRMERIAPIRSTPTSAGGKKKGAGHAKESEAAKAHRELQSLVDGLLPDDAQQRELHDKATKLGKALAAGLLPLDTYKRAQEAISAQITEIHEKVRGSVAIDGTLAPVTGSAVASVAETEASIASLGEQLKTVRAQGTGDLSALRDSLTDLAYAGSSTFGRMADMILNTLLPALAQLRGSMGGGFRSSLVKLVGLRGSTMTRSSLLADGALAGGGASIGFSQVALPNFGGFRKNGGGINANDWYVVGEDGPEMFAPGVSGTIIPNGGRGSGPSQQPAVVQVSVQPGQMFVPIVERVSGNVAAQYVNHEKTGQAKRARQSLA